MEEVKGAERKKEKLEVIKEVERGVGKSPAAIFQGLKEKKRERLEN